MATDQLILGGLIFDGWSSPVAQQLGGKQALKVHKLPGGSRVIDILGPDEMDIPIKGVFYGPDAEGNANALDAMRIAGDPVGLSFLGKFYTVIVSDAVLTSHRYPQWYEYSIVCTVSDAPGDGALGGISSDFSDLVGADMSTALSIIGF